LLCGGVVYLNSVATNPKAPKIKMAATKLNTETMSIMKRRTTHINPTLPE
jgi:hypothetical protein